LQETKEASHLAKLGVLVAMENCLEQVAGNSVAIKVMDGSKQITEKTDSKKIARWVKEAIDRLDNSVDMNTRVKVMQDCGYNCAKKNHRVIERAVSRRKKYMNMDDFLKAEVKKPIKGTKLVRDGDIVYQFYTPQTFARPMRCYCSLLRGLPAQDKVSITYCNCSKGFVEKYWEAILQKPVKVDLLQSAISGSKECKFAIHI
jgi:predicted hydrocarbon binding protein